MTDESWTVCMFEQASDLALDHAHMHICLYGIACGTVPGPGPVVEFETEGIPVAASQVADHPGPAAKGPTPSS